MERVLIYSSQRGRGAERSNGSALIETVVALPLLLLITLSAVQWGLIYQAKSSLEYAALMAARAGSVAHADIAAVRDGLARGLLPLYSPPKNAAGALRTMTGRVLPDVESHTRIRILNPTVEAFDDFAEINADGVAEIPNRDLHRRPTDPGPRSGMPIQDANLLKVEVLYGYQLKVPLVGALIARIARHWQRDGDARAMLADRRLPILASSVVRMQSAARENDFMISRDGTTPGRVLAGDGTAGGSGPGSGGPTDPGPGQGGESQSPPGGWSPVAVRAVPYRPSPAPIPATGQEGGPGGAGSGGVPPIVDDPGAGDFPMCQASPHLAAVSPAQPSQQVGNPIHVVTGNKYQREVDLNALPGALGLRFERHYNSRVHRLRPMGYGWRHSYDATVSAQRDGSVLLHQADGRAIVFQRGYGSPAIPAPTPTPETGAAAQRVSYPPPAPDSGLRLGALRVEDGELEMLQGRRGYVWHWRSGRTLHFDARGRLHRIQSPGGASTTLSYDPDGRLVQVRDPQLRSLQLFYDRHQRLVRTIDPGGLHTDYGYDTHNNLTSVHYADGSVRKYHYEDPGDPHNLTGITDARGVRFATYRYDEHDRAVLSTHADGAGKVALRYERGRTLVTDAQGQTSTYYTALDNNVPRVTRINGPGCAPCEAADLAYMYNARSQLTAVWDKRGRGKRYSYDFRGRLTGVDELGSSGDRRSLARYYYIGRSHRLASVERPGVDPKTPHTITFRYDGHGRLTKLIESGSRPFMGDSSQVQRYEPITRATNYRYSGRLLAAIDGPREDVTDITRLSYDRLSRLVGVQPPSGPAYRVREYDVYGRPKQVQFGAMMPTLLNYDARGRLIKLRRGDLAVSYRYDPDGRLTTLQDSDGIAYQAWYDPAGRLLGLADASNSQLLLLRDHTGAVHGVSSHDGKGNLLRAVYHQVPRIEPTGENAFRLAHLPRALSTPGGTLETDAFGMLKAIVHADGRRTEIGTTTSGRVSEVINVRGHRTRYHHDDFGNRIAKSSPDTGLSVYGYDAAGNRTYTRNANGREIHVEYDALGRPLRQRDDEGTTTYQYAHGRLREIRHPVSPESFQYDAWGRLVDHTRELGGRHFRTRYEYDERSGRLLVQTLPDGQVLRYHYQEKTGALRAVTRKDLIGQTTIVGELQHQPFGPITGFVHGNGLVTRFRYRRNGRLLNLDTEQVQRLAYTYDKQGAITGIRRNGSEEQYGYDNAGRLVSATLGHRRFTYRYDPAGNRLQKTERSTDRLYNTEYVYLDANNRLRNRKANSQIDYQYDRAGNPLRIGARSYRYNDHNRPIEWRARGQLRAQYAYNAWGERVGKVVHRNGKRIHTYFLYDRNRLSAEIDGHGRVVAQYIYLGDLPVAKLEGKRIYHIHGDHLGTPRAVTDRDGAVVWAADYDPFGRARMRIQKIDLPLRLPGQYEDQESGTHYNYFRDYDPDTGRYVTPDPIGLAGGPNIFAYADGNPVKWADPWGLYLVAFDGTWNDRAAMVGHETNVALFELLYRKTTGLDTRYIDGVGTDSSLDKFLGGAFGAGGQRRLDEAVSALVTHLASSNDGDIDVVGFSRGAAMAREFVNRIATMAARNEISQPFRIRFLGLFDTVGSFGIPGNSCDIGYDLSIPTAVEFAAHAIALNEHRPFFPLSSIEPRAGLRGSDATRVEQGFLGAHSDIGGGYADGDLSDVALNWMVEQARRAGVPLGRLAKARRKVESPILHDKRSFYEKLIDTDRDVYYPNHPNWTSPRQDLFDEYDDSFQPPKLEAEKTRDHPDYPVLRAFIEEGNGGARVDMQRYGEWLEHNRDVHMDRSPTNIGPP